MSNPVRICLSFALVLMGLGALIICLALQPPPGRPHVTAGFLGYTNDAAGKLLARFAITNRSGSTVLRPPVYFLEDQAPAEPREVTNFQSLGVLPGGTMLPAGAGDIVTVTPPTNGAPWRIYFRTYPDTVPERVVKGTAAVAVRAIGIKPRYSVVWYAVNSEWVTPRKSLPESDAGVKTQEIINRP